MTLSEAVSLIRTDHISQDEHQVWADLGCGNGLFSRALMTLLPKNSTIYAIDQKPFSFSEQNIRFLQLNFEKEGLPLPSLDGIMMINSLHFIKDKVSLLNRLKEKLLPGGAFLIGEYELTTSNPWVPYPITYNAIKELFNSIGFDHFEKISEKQSTLNRAIIYSAFVSKDEEK